VGSEYKPKESKVKAKKTEKAPPPLPESGRVEK
jgi:hypothetical protein